MLWKRACDVCYRRNLRSIFKLTVCVILVYTAHYQDLMVYFESRLFLCEWCDEHDLSCTFEREAQKKKKKESRASFRPCFLYCFLIHYHT
ncbi:hypothetical protein F5Y12DRAFT_750635 [Xylaria sp. FL1777]|nr:hypothetical protein F5Y12DRAFT_750635 [Xylaria sp. FL1777]